MKAVDLHVHSNRSDGTFSPTQLVDYAMEKGLQAFALTDHDTVDGLEEAICYAQALRAGQRHFPAGMEGSPDKESAEGPHGQSLSPVSSKASPDGESAEGPHRQEHSPAAVPEVIPGIEFSTEYQGLDVHIVGLYIDYHNAHFLEQLHNFVSSRNARNQKMCRLLQEAGIPVTYEALLAEFPDAVITRAHYAKFMLNHGYIRSMSEAFDRYVGDHCPCYVPREKVSPAQAVQLVLDAGGVPILAHPTLYHMNDERLETLTTSLAQAGLMGLEAIYSTYTAAEERQMRALAARHGLLASGGSDFHGANKPGLDLAVGYGRLYVPSSVLEEIKKRHKP